MDKHKLIRDGVFNKLMSREDLHKNDLFVFWDILRSVYGESSCIDEHTRLAGEISCEVDSQSGEGENNGA